jgi:hypothetical protein
MSIQTFSDGFRYIVVDQISIFNQNNKPWIIYPNPANDHIYIKGDINIEKLSIYSLLGAKIDCPIIEKHNNKVAIQIDHLSSGIYIFQINSGNQIYFYTWEKQ